MEIRLLDSDGGALIDVTARIVRIQETLEARTFAVEFNEVQDDDTIRRACASAGKPPPLPARRPPLTPQAEDA